MSRVFKKMLTFRSYASSSSGNLHSITDGETTIIVDCGLPWKQVQKAFDFKTSGISAVLCCHAHLDHSKGVPGAAGAGLNVYLLPETRKALRLSGHRYHDIKLFETFSIGTIAVKAFSLEHDVPNCGFLFAGGGEKSVYITDTYYSKFRFTGLNIIAIECNYSIPTLAPDLPPEQRKRLLRSHFSLENLKIFLSKNDLSRVREIWLLHLSRGNSDAENFKREIAAQTGIPVQVAGE